MLHLAAASRPWRAAFTASSRARSAAPFASSDAAAAARALELAAELGDPRLGAGAALLRLRAMRLGVEPLGVGEGGG